MNHRFKKIRKVIKIIALVIIFILSTSGCGSRYYRGDYPELFTVALNSLLGARGVANNEIDDPRIIVLEEDNHGRTLFVYGERRELGISILISQKSDGDNVYFYPHYNFIIFETFVEMTSRERLNGLRMNHFYPEVIEQIDELKERNDWNQEINLEKSTRREIDVNNNYNRKGPVRDSVLLETYNTVFGEDAWRAPLSSHILLLTTDDYGRSVYLGISRNLRTEDEDVRVERRRYLVMFFQPDGYFDEVKGVMELEDMFDYQTALREFKELNGWNQPFEGSISIPLMWIVIGLMVIVGASGLLGVQLYLRKRREISRINWLPIMKEDNLGQLLISLGSKPIVALIGRLTNLFSPFPLGKGKRRIFSLLYIITPSLLVNGLFFLYVLLLSSLHLWYFIAFLYLATVIGVALFFKYKPCEFYVLLLGFALSPVVLFVYAIVLLFGAFPFSLGIIPFLASLMAAPTLLYALPFIGISFLLKSRLQK